MQSIEIIKNMPLTALLMVQSGKFPGYVKPRTSSIIIFWISVFINRSQFILHVNVHNLSKSNIDMEHAKFLKRKINLAITRCKLEAATQIYCLLYSSTVACQVDSFFYLIFFGCESIFYSNIYILQIIRTQLQDILAIFLLQNPFVSVLCTILLRMFQTLHL